MTKISFVILHYNNIDDTLNCVDSIDNLKHDNIDVNIVLVDNCSPNGSGKTLEEKYQDRKDIKVILLDKNYGFTYSNNIGYDYARKNGADIILVSNNDIIIEDEDFLNNLLLDYKNYDVIAPDIINLNGQHQNPLRDKPYSLKKAYKNLYVQRLYHFILYIPFINKLFINWNNKREERWLKNYYETKIDIDNHNFVPFGAFVIYVNDWIKKEDKAFVGESFMYTEEECLGLYILKKKYRIFYDEKLKVKHLEGRSTQNSIANQVKRMKFRTREQAIAIKKYIKFYRKMVK